MGIIARAFRHPGTTTPGLAGLPGPLRCPWAPPSSNAASGPIKARFHDILLKVSHNQEVSPKYHEKACHSPGFQNEARKSPLEIPRFPFCVAFSHKELLGHFDACWLIIVKMTKCRQYVHPWIPRARVARYPHGSRRQAAPGTRSSSSSARAVL